MTNTAKTSPRTAWWQVALALLLFVCIVIGFYFLLRQIWLGFSILQKEVAAAIVAASATVLISVLSLIISKHWERIKEIQQEHRGKKIPIYEEFIQFWFKVLFSQKTGAQQIPEKEITKFLIDFTQKLILWGSDEFLKGFSNFKRRHANVRTDSPQIDIMFEFEKLLYSIRKDTGHKNRNLKKGDILALFINDIDRYLNQS